MSAWSVKTRHAPSRHYRDARVYGHTTAAMHEIERISPIEYTPNRVMAAAVVATFHRRLTPLEPPRGLTLTLSGQTAYVQSRFGYVYQSNSMRSVVPKAGLES